MRSPCFFAVKSLAFKSLLTVDIAVSVYIRSALPASDAAKGLDGR